MAATRNIEFEVHPVVILQILDHHARRNPTQKRVIGAILGSENVDRNLVEIKSCFPVPHEETESSIDFDAELHRAQFDLHHKVTPRDQVIGWYSTGSGVTKNDATLHEYMKGKTTLLLLVDSTAPSSKLQAFQATSLTIGGSSSSGEQQQQHVIGTNFDKVPVRYSANAFEKIGLNALKAASSSAMNPISTNQFDQLENSLQQLYDALGDVHVYVNKVISGETKPDQRIGKLLNEALVTVNQLNPAVLEKAFNESLQELLAVTYLANLTKQQLVISEKLHASPTL